MIVDLHTHTFLSDGALVPSESVRRAKSAGYVGMAITDHVDFSNYKTNLTAIKDFKLSYIDSSFTVLAGGEITHVRPNKIVELVARMRELEADIIVVHGETITEPVEEGTNRAAILAGVDILAHPGLLTESDAYLAAERGVHLEITTRRGHSYGNGHIVALAKKTGAKLVVNNDAHGPSDFVGENFALKVLQGAGLTLDESLMVLKNTVELFEKKYGQKLINC